MTTDYGGNSKKQKRQESKEKEPLEPVVKEAVIVKKKTIGNRMKNWVTEIDLPSVSKYVFLGVLIPAAKNMVFEAWTETLRQTLWSKDPRGMRGRGMMGGGSGTRYNYQTLPSRQNSRMSQYTPDPASSRMARHARDDVILVDPDDASGVMERMHEELEQGGVVTLRQLNELIGRGSSYVDESWGWTTLAGSRIINVPEGYLLDLPPLESLR